jgi:hypothetical protein
MYLQFSNSSTHPHDSKKVHLYYKNVMLLKVLYLDYKYYHILSFQQQIAKYLIKFEILTSTLGFLILKFSSSTEYTK